MSCADPASRSVARRLALWLVAVLCSAPASLALAQGAPPAYRQVFVPADDLPGRIRGLLPFGRSEFDRLVQQMTQPGKSPVPVGSRIDEVRCLAHLEGDKPLSGFLKLAIVAPTGPSLISLEPCDLLLGEATWQDNSPAKLGIGPNGALVCLAENSGTLRIAFHLPPAKTAQESATFNLRLPAALRQRLEITAPASRELTATPGLVASRETLPHEPEWSLWTIELGGRSQTQIHIAPLRQPSDPTPFVVREASTYQVLQETLDVETNFSLDVLGPPLSQLQLLVDSQLALTSLRLKTKTGDQPLSFSPTGAAAEGPRAFIVQLPVELSGINNQVQIAATGYWPIEKRARLPRLSISGGLYQQGTANIFSAAWLRLEARPQAGCVQTAFVPATPGRNLDQFEFQLHGADAAIEVAANHSLPSLRESSGTQIQVDATQVAGVLIADVVPLGGERFSLDVRMPRHWILDSLETQPPDLLADRSRSSAGPGQQQLHLNLSRPISETRPLRLLIRAHVRRPAAGQPLTADFFRVATFGDVRDSRRLLSVRMNDPRSQPQLAGDENLPRVDIQRLSAAELRLFEGPPGPLLVNSSEATETLRGLIFPAASRYRAEIVMQAFAENDGLRQKASIVCQPEGSPLASLLVRLAPRPGGAVTWRLGGEDSRELQAQLVSQAQPSGASAAEALYRLTLPRPRNTSVEITGEWLNEIASDREVSLAWLPEASEQLNLVEIHSAKPGPLSIHAEDVQSLPLSPGGAKQVAAMRARYRYESGGRARIRIDRKLQEGNPTAAWVDELLLHSVLTTSNRAHHEAKLTVENLGASQLALSMPGAARNVRLVEGELAQETALSSSAAGRITIPLLQSGRFQLRIRYSTEGTSPFWHLQHRVAIPIPQLEIPVLSRRWRVELPPGLNTVASDQGSSAAEQDPQLLAQANQASKEVTEQNFWQTLGEALLGPALAQRSLAQRSLAKRSLAQRSLAQRSLAQRSLAQRSLAQRSLAQRSWTVANHSSSPSFAGWSTLDLSLPTGAEASLTVYRPEVAILWSICLAFLSAAIIAALARRLGSLVLPLAGLIVAIAIGLSGFWAWVAGGIGLGLLAAGARLCYRPRQLVTDLPPPSIHHGSSLGLAAGPAAHLLVWLCLLLPGAVWAVEPEDAQRHASPAARVVIPVDEKSQPSGDYVFLEPQLYDILHRLAQSSAAIPAGHLLESAHYELPAAPLIRESTATIDEFHADFILHTFSAAATVELPLRRDQVLLLDGRARLDGQPVTLAWQSDGTVISLPVPEPGKHHLRLSLGAVARLDEGTVLLDIAIPPAARAVAELPADADDRIQVNPPADAAAEAATTGRQIPLGSATRLTVRWPIDKTAQASPAGVEAEQLLWWNIRPGSVVVDGKFRLHAAGGTLRQVILEVDPRLRLVPGPADESTIHMVEGATNLVRVELPESSGASAEVNLTWLWPDVLGAGTLVLPRVTVQAARIKNSWTAISTDASLQAESTKFVASYPAAPEFAAAWGAAKTLPSLVLNVGTSDSHSVIAVRPVPVKPNAVQKAEWSFSGGAAKLELHLDLTGIPKTLGQYRLGMPRELQVLQAAVQQDGKPAPSRWSQQPDGLLTVTLLEPPEAHQALVVSARMRLPRSSNQFPLPHLHPEDARLVRSQLELYRQSDLQLQLQSDSGWTKREDAVQGQYREQWGRLVAVLETDEAGSSKQPVVSYAPNMPQVSGVTIVRVSEEDGDWRGELEVGLTVADGLLDQVCLAIPNDWSGPLEVDPPMANATTVAVDGARLMLVRPPQAVTDQWRLTLRGSLSQFGGGVHAPEVTVLDVPNVHRYVQLDARSGADRIEWQMVGLRPADPANVALPAHWQTAESKLFQVVGQRFHAVARPQYSPDSKASARLADVQVTLHPGHFSARAAFLIRPGGVGEVEFLVPPGCRLIQALTNGALAQAAPLGLHTWRVAAANPRLPYLLTVVYDGVIPADAQVANSLTIPAPQLVGINVESHLWSVYTTEFGHTTYSLQETRHTSQEADLARLESYAAALTDVGAAQSTDLPPAIVAEEFQRWQSAYRTVQQRLKSSLPDSTAKDAAAKDNAAKERAWTNRLAAAESAVAAIDQRFPQWRPGGDDAAVSSKLDWGGQQAEYQPFIVLNQSDKLELSLKPVPLELIDQPISWAIAIAAFSILLWPLLHCVPAQNWLMAHAHLVLAVVGVAWWLCAPAGWLGWPLVMIAMWLATRWSWRRRTFELGSTIRRVALR